MAAKKRKRGAGGSPRRLWGLLLLLLIAAALLIALRYYAAQAPEEPVPTPAAAPVETPAPTTEPTAAPAPARVWGAGNYIAADPLADVALRLPEGASPDDARAWYYAVLRRILDEYGSCEAEYEGWGLAFAQLIDFDGDGTEELYLYYVDDDASVAGVRGYKGKVVHEEIWHGGDCIFRCHHWDSSEPEDEELDSDGRALSLLGNQPCLCAAGRVTRLGRDSFRGEQLRIGPAGVAEDLRATAGFAANSPSAVLDADLLAAYGLREGEMQNGAVVSVFTDGTAARNGETQVYDYHNCLATFTSTYTQDGGLPQESAIRVLGGPADSCVNVLLSLQSAVRNGQQLIFADDYIQIYEDSYVHFHWRLNDYQSLVDRLASAYEGR